MAPARSRKFKKSSNNVPLILGVAFRCFHISIEIPLLLWEHLIWHRSFDLRMHPDGFSRWD